MGNDELMVQHAGDHILVVTINRPSKRNAVNGAVANGIDEAVKFAEGNPAIRVVLLAGAGELSFCAGADLGDLAAGRAQTLSTPDGGFAGLVRAERRTPWIAVLEAPANGGGTELCLACDMVVASHRASFALPEVKRGLIAGAAGVFRLPRRIAPAIAHEMLMTGDPISAQRGYELGLVNRLVETGEAMNCAMTIAERIAANAPLGVQASLAVARLALDVDEAGLFTAMAAEGKLVHASSDAKEGTRAFLEKRAPLWRGQ